MMRFNEVNEADRELYFWHNKQRTDPSSLCPMLQKELESMLLEEDSCYSYLPYHSSIRAASEFTPE